MSGKLPAKVHLLADEQNGRGYLQELKTLASGEPKTSGNVSDFDNHWEFSSRITAPGEWT